MTDLTDQLERLSRQNPAERPAKDPAERRRVPFTTPIRKLEVPELPGYHLRWVLGTPQRIGQALQAGYEFVSPDEVQLNNSLLGDDPLRSGNTDLGSRVSVVAGGVDETGQALRLYLMKQKLEFYLEDQAVLDRRNAAIADALLASFTQGTVGGPAPGETAQDMAARYVDRSRTRIPDLFRRKR